MVANRVSAAAASIRRCLRFVLPVAAGAMLATAHAQATIPYADVHDFGGSITYPGGHPGPDGIYPNSTIVEDANGNIFGTAESGGSHNAGLVWELTTEGAYIDLHDFGGSVMNTTGGWVSDGTTLANELLIDASGNLLGVTQDGGANGNGMLWEMSPAQLRLLTFSITPNSITGGTSLSGTANLNAQVLFGTAVIKFASTSPDVVPPNQNTLSPGQSAALFTVKTLATATYQNVTVTASYNGVSLTSNIVINAPHVKYFGLSKSSVLGGTSVSGTVGLTAAAGSSGVVVTLGSNNPNVIPPKTATIPAGQDSGSFSISTSTVSIDQVATLTASGGGGNTSAALTLTDGLPAVSTLTFTPATVGGATLRGTVTFNVPVPSGGSLVVQLASDNGFASPPDRNTISAGGKTASFSIWTSAVTSTQTANLTATANNVTVSATLQITPIPN